MTDLFNRRGILRGLAALPLIGGGVTLIGQPTASAEPISNDLLEAYNEWLFYERRLLAVERYGLERSAEMERYVVHTPAQRYHFSAARGVSWQSLPQPSTRAAIVLSAVGCDWKEHGDD
jgi:hypothetical protein